MKINIGTKIILGFAGVLILMIVMGAVVLVNVNDSSRQYDLILDKDSPMISNANEIYRVVVDMQAGIRGYVITH
jgi:CHASE3 domain sensor protein